MVRLIDYGMRAEGSQDVGVDTEQKRQTMYVWGQSIFLVRLETPKK